MHIGFSRLRSAHLLEDAMTRLELWQQRYDLGGVLKLTRHARKRAIERDISPSAIRVALAHGDWVCQQGRIRVAVHPATSRPHGVSASTWEAARAICVVVCHSGHIPTAWRRNDP
jgi:hypothetical protein